MKFLFFLFILTLPIFSQDQVRTKDGQSIKGEVEILKEQKSVKINKTSGGFTFVNFDNIKNIKDSNGKVIWTYERYLYDLNAAEKKKDCEKNSDISIIMMPVSNDFYGVSEFLNNEFSTACFDIRSNMNGLKYLDTKKLLPENINDFHLSEIGISGEVDYVAHGFAYTINIPNKSSPTSVASGLIASSNLATGDLTSFIDALPSTFSALSNVKHQNMLAEKAGTYLLVTYYFYNMATGKKEFIYQNTIIQNLG